MGFDTEEGAEAEIKRRCDPTRYSIVKEKSIL